jgi:hypothetical protein
LEELDIYKDSPVYLKLPQVRFVGGTSNLQIDSGECPNLELVSLKRLYRGASVDIGMPNVTVLAKLENYPHQQFFDMIDRYTEDPLLFPHFLRFLTSFRTFRYYKGIFSCCVFLTTDRKIGNLVSSQQLKPWNFNTLTLDSNSGPKIIHSLVSSIERYYQDEGRKNCECCSKIRYAEKIVDCVGYSFEQKR